ncbi:MAG: hypothetical protein R3B13_07895 [Polyangiaceae bacterium]
MDESAVVSTTPWTDLQAPPRPWRRIRDGVDDRSRVSAGFRGCVGDRDRVSVSDRGSGGVGVGNRDGVGDRHRSGGDGSRRDSVADDHWLTRERDFLLRVGPERGETAPKEEDS